MMSLNCFESALRKAQTSMDNISKDMLKRRHLAEKQIESLRSEMEESLFFHELDDSDEIDVESFEEKPAFPLGYYTNVQVPDGASSPMIWRYYALRQERI